MQFPRCDQTPAWASLAGHWQAHGRDIDLSDLFHQDPGRFDRWAIQAPHMLVDMSRVHWDLTTFQHLQSLAQECHLPDQRHAMLAGEPINSTENRAVLHTALRAPHGYSSPHNREVHHELDRFLAFAEQVRARAGGSAPGDIHDVVCLGIGGSYLGPQMVVGALQSRQHAALRFHFVSNLYGQELGAVLQQVQPKHTLFVVASKSFSTLDTLANAVTARQWFLARGGQDVAKHFVATTANPEAASQFGITTAFKFWDWVGGRFSLWSSIGLPIAIALGASAFRELLNGAHEMDRHFAEMPAAKNVPICLGLMDVWYRNFMGYSSRCISPYVAGLQRLPAYLQQLMMESNGKRVDQDGSPVSYGTSDVIWGEPGTNGQHAFFQMLHQGTDTIPVEFLLVKRPCEQHLSVWPPAMQERLRAHHQWLLANGLAQARALMVGRQYAAGGAADHPLDAHRAMPGNRPSLTLLLNELTPASLGALVALYEHRTFVSGALWGINSFDQWGVELGKLLCQELTPMLVGDGPMAYDSTALDPATQGLLQWLRTEN